MSHVLPYVWFYDAFASVFLRCSFKQAMLKKWNFLYLYMISYGVTLVIELLDVGDCPISLVHLPFASTINL
ncbi:hypothetical protein V6Z11_D12G279000 [Gossypium hirsutum]